MARAFEDNLRARTLHTYVGDVVDGLPDGEGTRVWPNGATYTGHWLKGKMSGQGEYTFSSGARYVGSWSNGKYNGEGTYTDSEGNSTHAIYENGKPIQVFDAPQNQEAAPAKTTE